MNSSSDIGEQTYFQPVSCSKYDSGILCQKDERASSEQSIVYAPPPHPPNPPVFNVAIYTTLSPPTCSFFSWPKVQKCCGLPGNDDDV